MNEKEAKARYKSLGLTPEEENALFAYDKAVEAGEKTPYDLTGQQLKNARIASKVDKADRKPTTYNFSKRERKVDEPKQTLIACLAEWLEHSELPLPLLNIRITNKERQIAFHMLGDDYELTLARKRKPKGGGDS